ncbi:diaminopimelate decarboxylase [Paenibacillus agilis]|uniref:Diaminopimelate decarboxylase n=1 Tax=Paenibacillus agilis TaxID=3020863 RepID=A0A559IVZ7_9BACL|nr:diaminopimelate decarboxylase [Paenibacillus agilis]TVX91810.1 diaminopimelate decarboxylase [Paenibacillus agilis]
MDVSDSSPSLAHNPVYCLGCQERVPAERTVLQFRTGFYKGQIPIGSCDRCTPEHAILAQLWNSLKTGHFY